MSDYNFKADSLGCWYEWLKWQRIFSGFATFATITDLYLCESWGLIP